MTISIDTQLIILQISVAVVGGVVIFMVQRYIKNADKSRKRHERQTQLQNIKLDSAIYALSNVNHGFGEDFKPLYAAKYKELIEQNQFIENIE